MRHRSARTAAYLVILLSSLWATMALAIDLLLNGKADEMAYQDGMLVSCGLSFKELKQRSWINPAARAANDDPDFSARIRRDRAGF